MVLSIKTNAIPILTANKEMGTITTSMVAGGPFTNANCSFTINFIKTDSGNLAMITGLNSPSGSGNPVYMGFGSASATVINRDRSFFSWVKMMNIANKYNGNKTLYYYRGEY